MTLENDYEQKGSAAFAERNWYLFIYLFIYLRYEHTQGVKEK